MLALYHLFSDVAPSDLPGVDAIMKEAKVEKLPTVRKVVLVGNRISPGNPVKKPDGTVIHTLWGEIAWQLGGKKAYETIMADDKKATSPGDRLRELFNQYGPCLILIDEWVAYARQLHDKDGSNSQQVILRRNLHLRKLLPNLLNWQRIACWLLGCLLRYYRFSAYSGG